MAIPSAAQRPDLYDEYDCGSVNRGEMPAAAKAQMDELFADLSKPAKGAKKKAAKPS